MEAGCEGKRRSAKSFLIQESFSFINADQLNSIQFSARHHRADEMHLILLGDGTGVKPFSTNNNLISE